MNLAGGALRFGNRGRVMDLLRETFPAPGEEDLRGQEWHSLFRQVFNESRVVPLPADGATGRMLFTDAKRLVFRTPTTPPRLLIVDAESGAELSSAEPTGTLALALAENLPLNFTPDGRRMATRRGSQFIVWDTATAKEVFRTPGFARGVPTLSPAGDRLAWVTSEAEADSPAGDRLAWVTSEAEADAPEKPAGVGNFAVVVCDTATGKRQFLWSPVNRKLEDQNRVAPAFSPDGRWVVFQLMSEWFLADMRTDRAVVANPKPVGNVPMYHCFSPEAARLALATAPDKVTVYDLTGEAPAVVAVVPGSGNTALSAKGAKLVVTQPGQGATTANTQLFVYDLTDPQLKPRTLPTGLRDGTTPGYVPGNTWSSPARGATVRFSPDEQSLLVTREDGSQVGGFAVLDPKGFQPAQVFDTIAPVAALNFRADRKRVFGVGDGTIREWAVTPFLEDVGGPGGGGLGFGGPGGGGPGGGGPGGGGFRPNASFISPDGRWEMRTEREKSSLATHLDLVDRKTGTSRRVTTAMTWSSTPSSGAGRVAVRRRPDAEARGARVLRPGPRDRPRCGRRGRDDRRIARSPVPCADRPGDRTHQPGNRTPGRALGAGGVVHLRRRRANRHRAGRQPDRDLRGRDRARGVSLAGRRVAASGSRVAGIRTSDATTRVFLFDRATGQTIEVNLGMPTDLQFSPGGRWLVLRSKGQHLVCDASDPKLPVVRTLEVLGWESPRPGNPFGGPSGSKGGFGGSSGSKGGFGGARTDPVDVSISPDDRLVGVAQNGVGKVVVSDIVSGPRSPPLPSHTRWSSAPCSAPTAGGC